MSDDLLAGISVNNGETRVLPAHLPGFLDSTVEAAHKTERPWESRRVDEFAKRADVDISDALHALHSDDRFEVVEDEEFYLKFRDLDEELLIAALKEGEMFFDDIQDVLGFSRGDILSKFGDDLRFNENGNRLEFIEDAEDDQPADQPIVVDDEADELTKLRAENEKLKAELSQAHKRRDREKALLADRDAALASIEAAKSSKKAADAELAEVEQAIAALLSEETWDETPIGQACKSAEEEEVEAKLSEAWEAGYRAFDPDAEPGDACPFDEDMADRRTRWFEGWNKAQEAHDNPVEATDNKRTIADVLTAAGITDHLEPSDFISRFGAPDLDDDHEVGKPVKVEPLKAWETQFLAVSAPSDEALFALVPVYSLDTWKAHYAGTTGEAWKVGKRTNEAPNISDNGALCGLTCKVGRGHLIIGSLIDAILVQPNPAEEEGPKPEYQEGWNACMAGEPDETCPYEVDSAAQAEWLTGYFDAERDTQEDDDPTGKEAAAGE